MSRLPLHTVDAAMPDLRGPATARDLETRVAALERRAFQRYTTTDVSNVASFSLGAIAGNKIVGVKTWIHGTLTGETAGGSSLWYWQINGGNIANASNLQKYAYWPSGGPFTRSGAGANLATIVGLHIGIVGFTSVGQSSFISSESTIFTPVASATNAAVRHSVSQFASSDASVSGHQLLAGEMYGNWYEAATEITSLSIVFQGQFYGRITTEIIQ